MINLGLTSTVHGFTAVNDFRVTYMRIINHLGNPVEGTGVTLSSLGSATPWGAAGGLYTINSALTGVPSVNLNNFKHQTLPGPVGVILLSRLEFFRAHLLDICQQSGMQ